MDKKIYLDYAATTPVDKKVLQKMLPYFSETFANASSVHSMGETARAAVEEARGIVANFFGAVSEEIIFTSGATESNNLAAKGALRAYHLNPENKGKIPHIMTTEFEHSCVLKAFEMAKKEGLAEVTRLKPTKDGLILVEDVKKNIRENTIFISIMYVNNEIGTVQPIAEIGKMIKSVNSKIIFHTDATQAVNYFDCNVENLGVDLLSMSAHKIYGPKGVGALYIRKGTNIKAVQDGGGQEFGYRSGTLNTPGIVGLGAAISMLGERDMKNKNKEIKILRDYLIDRVLSEIKNSTLNGSQVFRSPNNANFSFPGVEGESLLLMLDANGIFCSTGSACSSGSLKPSHVLLSLGKKPEEAHSSLRVTLGKHTTKKDINAFMIYLNEVVAKIREISGNVLEDYYANQTKK